MAERSFAALRSREALGPAFPDRPTLPLGRPCDGIAAIGRRAPDLTALRDLRDHITGIWQGDLNGDPAARLLVVSFDGAIRFDVAVLPSALPLIRIGEGLASYVSAATAPRGRSEAPPRRVQLWWNGEAVDVAFDALEPVPLAVLWELPCIVVHRSTAPVSRAGQSGGSAETADVGLARIPIREKRIAAFDETDRALDALHERTKAGAILRQMLGSLWPSRNIGDAGQGGERRARSDGRSHEPGVLENLAGWVRWHTPLGKGLIAAFGNRMRLVEKLIQSGDVDSALKMALKLGSRGDEAQRARYPNRLPGMRWTLDFNIGTGGFSMPILGGAAFESLRSRYLQMASALEHHGDFRRAAYVRAQLLGEHQNAVLTLERGELFADAARLALDAKLSPALYIRLFYKAGELDTALALARRACCFDTLAEDSRKAHPEFHAYVLKAWTDVLSATGQHLRALQVTDDAAGRPDADAALINLRRAWLHAAIEGSDTNALSSELTVRTLFSGDWSKRDFAAFPHLPRIGNAPGEAGLERIQAVIRQKVSSRGDETAEFLSAILRLADPESPEQKFFWSGPAPTVFESFARAMLRAAPAGLIQREIGSLVHLAKMASLEVLAADLGKLRAIRAAPAAPAEEWMLPPPSALASPVLRACLLHNGNILVSRQNSLLQLLDRHGTVLWQGSVGDVEALIAVGSGANVILVQNDAQGAAGSRRLTRFATHSRNFHPIGALDLVAWHDVTSEGQWMVQVGGQIGALDLVKLCGQKPAAELLWSCALTAAVHATAFYHDPGTPSWMTVSSQSGCEGVVEKWMLVGGRELTPQIARPVTAGRDSQILRPSTWWWGQYALPPEDLRSDARLPFLAWSEKDEREIARKMAERRQLYPEADEFLSGDFNRSRVVGTGASHGGAERTVLTAAGPKGATMTIRHDGEATLRCLARGTKVASDARGTDLSGTVLLADSHGRILRVDLAANSVAVL
jgi:hypothetical protein